MFHLFVFLFTIFLPAVISDSPYTATDVVILDCAPGQGSGISFHTPDLETEGGVWLTWRYSTPDDRLEDARGSAPAIGYVTALLRQTPPGWTLLAVEWRATEPASLIHASCRYGVVGLPPAPGGG